MTFATKHARRKVLPAAPRHLVWLSTGFIGDVLLSTAAVAAGIKAFPHAKHHFITTSVGARVVKSMPGLASVTVFEKRTRGAVAAVRAFQAVRRALFELIPADDRDETVLLQVHLSYRSGFLARYLQTLGLRTVNFAEASLGAFAAARVPRVAVLHEAERVALLLSPLGVPRAELMGLTPSLLPLSLPDAGAAVAQALPAYLAKILAGAGPRVAVAPGSVWATKRWTPEGFAYVVKGILRAAPTACIYFLGSEADVGVTGEVRRLAALSDSENARVFDLAGKTELDDLCRIFPRLDLLVVNDSAQVHYASAFGVPTVALFGPTTPAMGFAPLAPKSVALGVKDLPCRPCSLHGPMRCPLGHFRCMKELAPETVLTACLDRLTLAQ